MAPLVSLLSCFVCHKGPLFMENLLSHRLSISTQDRFFLPVNPDKLFSTIAAEDIAFAGKLLFVYSP